MVRLKVTSTRNFKPKEQTDLMPCRVKQDEVIMGEATIMQTLRYRALQRAIGELMAARETMRLEENGEYDPLDKVIQDCITMLKDNM